MSYKSTDINTLKDELHKRVVTFEFAKKDGTTRVAQGTMNAEYLPEPLPDRIYLEADAVDALMEAKEIMDIEEYASENGMTCISREQGEDYKTYYVFKPIKKLRKVNEDTILYYDVEKDAFRSFHKENFKGIIK